MQIKSRKKEELQQARYWFVRIMVVWCLLAAGYDAFGETARHCPDTADQLACSVITLNSAAGNRPSASP